MATAASYEKNLEAILDILQKLPPADQQRLLTDLLAELLRQMRSAEESTAGAPAVTLREFSEILRTAPPLTDEEAEEFAQDVRWIRAEMNALPLRDPWQS